MLGPNHQIKMYQESLKTPNQKLELQSLELITHVIFISQKKGPEEYMFLEAMEVLTMPEKPLMIYMSLTSKHLNGKSLNQAATHLYYQIAEEDTVPV